MNGIDASTGRRLSGLDHLRQSITDILTTPIGTRVMRREYGSRLYRLVDAPVNRGLVLDLYAAVAEALARWEPRFDLQEVRATDVVPGKITLSLQGLYLPNGEPIVLDGIEVR
jgi:phage baseplate assembly protein W